MISQMYRKAMKELDEFFELNWKYNTPVIIIVPDRKTIDKLKQQKTENWITGWAEVYNSVKVYLLDPTNYEKESCHKYSKQEYFILIKHELAHCFTTIMSNYSYTPIWLFEGISLFLSGENKIKKKPKKFVNLLDSYNQLFPSVYDEAGFFVEILVTKYGKEKLIELVKKLNTHQTQEEFNVLFKSIYGLKPTKDNINILI